MEKIEASDRGRKTSENFEQFVQRKPVTKSDRLDGQSPSRGTSDIAYRSVIVEPPGCGKIEGFFSSFYSLQEGTCVCGRPFFIVGKIEWGFTLIRIFPAMVHRSSES